VPRILMGDLNRRPGDLRAVEAARLTLAGGGPTWPAAAPRHRIDHVAVQGLGIASVEVVPTPCSDHRALAATLTWGRPAKRVPSRR
jgi:endonuclease/exonuclease/phosphatase family metal-dependent hydrolase